MADRDLKALDAALDFSKQQISFASVLLSVTLAFSGNLLEKLPSFAKFLAAGSWVLLLGSIGVGLSFLGYASYLLQENDTITQLLRDTRIYAVWQMGFLAVAASLLVGVVFTGLSP